MHPETPGMMIAPQNRSDEYPSYNDCVLDIIANTDCGFRTAEVAARYVYAERWTYDNGFTPRGVIIEHPNGQRIEMREVT